MDSTSQAEVRNIPICLLIGVEDSRRTHWRDLGAETPGGFNLMPISTQDPLFDAHSVNCIS